MSIPRLKSYLSIVATVLVLGQAVPAQAVELPDFTLSGKILFDRTKAGSTRQVAYIFQMSLVDTATNRVVWEDEKTITKQGKRAPVSW